MFIRAVFVCNSLQCLNSPQTQGGEGGHLFSLTCSVALWGGRNTANKYHWRVWGVLAVSWPHWVCPCCTLLRLQVALQGNCLKQALGCMHFPGLNCSGSGSRVLHKGWLGLRFVPFPGSSSSGDLVLGECSRPRLKAATYRLPHPCHSVFWVYNGRAFSGVPFVSSGELISGCDPPGGCQPSRIPGRLG